MDQFSAPADFDGPLKDLIHDFKYRGKGATGTWLAEKVLAQVLKEGDAWDIVIPVPIPFWKDIKRGYNPAALIAGVIAKATETPFIPHALNRRWWASSQTNLDRKGRLRNARSNFSLNCRTDSILGMNVLLVDDVCTTGATLQACSALLKQAGARRVWGVALAKDQPTGHS